MPKSLLLSLLFHFGIAVLLVYGLPDLLKRNLTLNNEYAVVADVVPISEITNIKAKAIPVSKAPDVALKPPPPAAKEPIVDEAESIPDAKNNKKPEESNKKPVKESKPKDDAFNKNMLKSIESAKKKRKEKKIDQDFDKLAEGLNAKTNKEYNNNLPLSLSEKDAIMSRIQNHWNTVAFMGAPDTQKLKMTLLVDLDSAGNVIKINMKSFSGSTQYKEAYFDSLERAIKAAAPYAIRDNQMEINSDGLQIR